MQRIGKEPIDIPKGVTLNLNGQQVSVKGPNGSMEFTVPPGVTIAQEENQIILKRIDESKHNKSCHGMSHRMISNMFTGVTEGFKKEMEMQGVGYRAQVQGKDLKLELQYSHPIVVKAPEGIKFECPNPTTIIVSGYDKQVIGQVAANIRAYRPPEPYKGKGIRYKDEYVRRKEGKAGKK